MLTCYCRACVELAQARLTCGVLMKTKGRRKSANLVDQRSSDVPIDLNGLSPLAVQQAYARNKSEASYREATLPKPPVKGGAPKPKPKPSRSMSELSRSLTLPKRGKRNG